MIEIFTYLLEHYLHTRIQLSLLKKSSVTGVPPHCFYVSC